MYLRTHAQAGVDSHTKHESGEGCTNTTSQRQRECLSHAGVPRIGPHGAPIDPDLWPRWDTA
eukprot:3830176-Prymnesium_polylepis.2